MNKELISNLTNSLLYVITALFLAAIFSMLIGYRIVAKRLVKNGMKIGDARAMGQAIAGLLFIALGFIYLKFFVLS